MCAKALRIGVAGTVMNPSNGRSISRIRKIASASDTAHTSSAITTVAWRGANRPKPVNRMVNQNTSVARKDQPAA
jgi:hypothetical protein